MSVATEFPPDVYIPAAARPRSLRAVPPTRTAPTVVGRPSGTAYVAKRSPSPVAPAAAALGAEVADLDRWRHHYVGAQVGGRRRIVADLRTRPTALADDAWADSAPNAPIVTAASPVRLTRRGIVALSAISALVALAIVAIAWLSASTTASAVGTDGVAGSVVAAVVTVHDGDSLWTIATRVAPNRDPRAEVAELRDRNHLTSDTVVPGQQLRVG